MREALISMQSSTEDTNQLALVMTGGGARAAYQVGCLKQLVASFPELKIPILTGVSAGAINAVSLAAFPGKLEDRVHLLHKFWRELSIDAVFSCTLGDVFKRTLYWGMRLLGGGHYLPMARCYGMVDTAPLWTHLRSLLNAEGDKVRGIQENIDAGELRALGVTGSSYTNGMTTTWIQGTGIEAWQREFRRSELVDIGVAEVMASAALPLLFPAVKVRGSWYGDGGIRLTAPLAPAIHLGASRILAISTRYDPPSREKADRCFIDAYPPPAQVMGALLNAVFLDQLDADGLRLQRTNELLAKTKDGERQGLRPIQLCILRPSQDLGELANRFEANLPPTLRFMTRGLGTRETRSNDMLSMLMFQNDYIEALMQLGMSDTAAREDELRRLLVSR
jgi:NTE family protein